MFHIRLKPSNCYYSVFPMKCRNCGEMKNIVCGLKWSKRITLLFK